MISYTLTDVMNSLLVGRKLHQPPPVYVFILAEVCIYPTIPDEMGDLPREANGKRNYSGGDHGLQRKEGNTSTAMDGRFKEDGRL